MAQHTPGPWTYAHKLGSEDRPALTVTGTRNRDIRRYDLRQKHGGPQTVAYVFTPTEPAGPSGGQRCTLRTIPEGLANAKLIATAPDLLAACEAVERLRVARMGGGCLGCGEPKQAFRGAAFCTTACQEEYSRANHPHAETLVANAIARARGIPA